MSAILAALANPEVDALAVQLISQGVAYFQGMQQKRLDGGMTEADVLEMAKKLDVNFDVLVEARARQRIREQQNRQEAQDPSTHSTAGTTPGTGPTTGESKQVGGNAT